MIENVMKTIAGVIILVLVIAGVGTLIALAETQFFGGELTQLIIPRSVLALLLLFGLVTMMIVWEEYSRWKIRKLRRIARDLKRREVYARYLRERRSASNGNS